MSNVTTITMPDAAALERKFARQSAPDRITTQQEYIAAAEARRVNKQLLDDVASTFDPLVKEADAVTRKVRALRAQFEEPLKAAIFSIDIALSLFEKEQAEQARRENDRIANELREQEVRKAREEAASLERLGYIKQADKVRQMPLPEPIVPVVPVAVPKVAGLSSREIYSAEVTDMTKLILAVAAGDAPQEVLLPNLPVLNSLARASKTALSIPGVKVVSKTSRAQRR